jgi:hypothetical protein
MICVTLALVMRTRRATPARLIRPDPISTCQIIASRMVPAVEHFVEQLDAERLQIMLFRAR